MAKRPRRTTQNDVAELPAVGASLVAVPASPPLTPSIPKPSLVRADPLLTATFATLESQLGGRASLITALVHASPTPDLERLLGLVADPLYSSASFADLCAMAGASFGDVLAAYRAGALAKAHVLATHEIASRLPVVTQDVMRRAAPYEETCYTCKGTGSVTSPLSPDAPPAPCETCAGAGALRYLPDLDRQKTALELGGLLRKSSGVMILNQQLANPGTPTAESLPLLQAGIEEAQEGVWTIDRSNGAAPAPADGIEESGDGDGA